MSFLGVSDVRGSRVAAAYATKSLKNLRRGSSAAKEVSAPQGPTAGPKVPKILTRMEQLKLLSKLESAGVLSKLESSGITLKYIEDNKLLSKAEELGVLSILTDRGVPGTINTVAFLLFAAAAATVFFVPDDSSALVALQSGLAVVLGGAGLAAFAGASFLGDLQKE